jgi:hypothetical protein
MKLKSRATSSPKDFPLLRYTGGGQGWGFGEALKKNPHPIPPPEYQGRGNMGASLAFIGDQGR